MPFQELGLSPLIVKAVQESGYTEPTPIQIRAVPAILSRHDVIGIAQTGTGKTAAFVLPILEIMSKATPVAARRTPRVLVVVPTRELAAQVEQNIRKYGSHLPFRSVTIYGGVGENPQIDALRRGVDLVVATPGRLLDLAAQGHVKFNDIEIVVLDEADRMLDMGFLPPIRKIMRMVPAKRQTLLFSASFSPEIEKTSAEFLTHPKLVQAGKRATPAETVDQFVYIIAQEQKVPLLLHLLSDPTLDSVLVFSRTKHGADKIARKLIAGGVETATLHSNRSQNQRIEALRKFKAGAVRVLVATDIAARGIDVVGISHVVNLDFPPQPEDYVHRIGRTGRAHAVGEALSFVTRADEAALRALERFIGRGIPRRTAEGFLPDPTARATEAAEAVSRGPRPQRPQQPRGTSQPRRGAQTQRASQPARAGSSGRPQPQGSGTVRPSATSAGSRGTSERAGAGRRWR